MDFRQIGSTTTFKIQNSCSLNIAGTCKNYVSFDFPKFLQADSCYKTTKTILKRENISLLVAAALAVSIMTVILSTAN
ncbi:MAG: hypothetical protein GWN01_05270 [Nitrosopumilaceae archaeon]|nr:hypothetical protein [Nitrosopumilaceae archaeon]NIU00354.1 hypothetical protein [Nitrosopumilaceae archaeon]NIU86756.1 hypothetical protein [Nitrosopumilaceae archaeon]NIV65456.1 hypothetical protein [Nitrosopumilaceae archaeon]NIX60956.1 hypothetical protein [Nitrosopumilaceae archaeon]